MVFPIHKPKRLEFIQQKKKWDCGIACVAMLTGLLYNDILPFFKGYDKINGLFPDDVLEVLDDLGITYRFTQNLPKSQPALITVEWKNGFMSGHYVVWDPERNQFIDPLHGLIDHDDMINLANISHIWPIEKSSVKKLSRARAAKAAAEKILEPFKPKALGLIRNADGSFAIEAKFTSEPQVVTKKIKGIPIKIVIEG